MRQEVVDVERALLALPENERVEVIQSGLFSLSGEVATTSDPVFSEHWHDEFRRRINHAQTPGTKLISREESDARVAEALRKSDAPSEPTP